MHDAHGSNFTPCLPVWVPRAAVHYLAHTERGQSIRALARENDCHPSTILRQVRRFEQRRDDPLVDDALRALSGATKTMGESDMETKAIDGDRWTSRAKPQEGLTQARIDQEAKRVLLRLCEPGAVMAVAREMETAVIVRETPQGDQLRTAVVDREIAQAMALKEWITCPDASGRIARYFVTNAGRAALRRLTAQDDNAASGFADTRSVIGPEDAWDINAIEGESGRSSRYQVFESPLVGLSRRRDRDGQPFLSRDLVVAGERLREDFELAKMGSQISADATTFMALVPVSDSPKGASAGHLRVQAALRDLGPGLSDVTFHCCCLLEGLENTEKSMGWSARSGKIVLRIALHRLKRHYEELGNSGQMIG
ncbi:MAG: helix-turn-helix domain-containing protein [Yoonia sp.]|nr:helix-turn-helix domain-containing protein [Yoonia sp.]